MRMRRGMCLQVKTQKEKVRVFPFCILFSRVPENRFQFSHSRFGIFFEMFYNRRLVDEAAVHTAPEFSGRRINLFREFRILAGIERAVAEVALLFFKIMAGMVWTAFRYPFVPVLASVAAEDKKGRAFALHKSRCTTSPSPGDSPVG